MQITAPTFRSLEGADALTVSLNGKEDVGALVTMECACAKGHGGNPPDRGDTGDAPTVVHRHHFLQSALFCALVPAGSVRLDLDGVSLSITVTPI